MPAAERQQECGTWWPHLPVAVPCNWPDTGLVSRPERAPTWVGLACEAWWLVVSEPEGKLDAMTTHADGAAQAAAVAVGAVNGPTGEHLDWDAINWRAAEEHVRRLRQRIFTATQAGDLKKVRNLQKLMLRSRANALLSVRRVTERNAGRKTAGVDGRVVLGAGEKAELADWLQHDATAWSPKPVKRVFIPKGNAKV